jgi:membrane-bound ClpP family serine protease
MLKPGDITNYFNTEKAESLVFFIIGIAAIVTAVFFYFIPISSFFEGCVIPLLVVGLIQAVVGFSVFRRSDSDKQRVQHFFDKEPHRLKTDEIPRMNKVNRNFVIYRWIELALFVAGMILSMVNGTNPGRSYWYGFGIALSLQSALMLVADYYAEKRALEYTHKLRSFTRENH